jgi:hypothetical protein
LGLIFGFYRNLPVNWRRKGIKVLKQFYYQIVVIRKGGIAGMMIQQTA